MIVILIFLIIMTMVCDDCCHDTMIVITMNFFVLLNPFNRTACPYDNNIDLRWSFSDLLMGGSFSDG